MLVRWDNNSRGAAELRQNVRWKIVVQFYIRKGRVCSPVCGPAHAHGAWLHPRLGVYVGVYLLLFSHKATTALLTLKLGVRKKPFIKTQNKNVWRFWFIFFNNSSRRKLANVFENVCVDLAAKRFNTLTLRSMLGGICVLNLSLCVCDVGQGICLNWFLVWDSSSVELFMELLLLLCLLYLNAPRLLVLLLVNALLNQLLKHKHLCWALLLDDFTQVVMRLFTWA